jgi:excisionase family DNA binding protein
MGPLINGEADLVSIPSCGTGDLPARLLYSPAETERLLSVSHATCYRLIAAGKLDARKLGSKTLITWASIERLLAELPKARGV